MAHRACQTRNVATPSLREPAKSLRPPSFRYQFSGLDECGNRRGRSAVQVAPGSLKRMHKSLALLGFKRRRRGPIDTAERSGTTLCC
jgi:hypothetical protein